MPSWGMIEPPLEPRAMTRKQERQVQLTSRLEDVHKEIRYHRCAIDNLTLEAEEIEYQLDDLE